MKKLFYSLLGLTFAFAACNTDPVGIDFTPEAPESRTDVVPIDEALGQLDAVMNAIAQSTRSEAFDYTRTIREIQVSGGALATRNGESDLPDTMAYVVNFTDDKGFAVLGAQRTLEPVYAITESGSFDASKLNDAIARAEKRRQNPVPDTRSEEKDQIYTDIGTDFAYELLAEAMVAQPRIRPDTLNKVYGEWKTTITVSPLVEVKWGQSYPFNIGMPKAGNDPNKDQLNRGRYAAGCAPVAAAQIMSCVRKPNYAPTATGTYYTWPLMKMVSNFNNCNSFHFDTYPDNLSHGTQNYTSQLSQVLYHIGKCFEITYYSDGSGVLDYYVVLGLKQLDSYFNNARLVNVESNLTSIYDNLDNNKPMYIRGSDVSTGRGHAWVVDGYFCQKRSVTTTIRNGYTGPITTLHGTEERRFLHFNWGNVGTGDGYFSEGIYNISKRFSKDGVIDHFSDEGSSKNYNSSNKVILY